MLDVALVWGTPGDIDRTSDGGGEFASGFKLTARGVAKVMRALGTPGRYQFAEFCGCRHPREGDGVHIAGEPSDLICLASPIITHQDRCVKCGGPGGVHDPACIVHPDHPNRESSMICRWCGTAVEECLPNEPNEGEQ